jgi:hypothetical protein
MGRKVLRWGIYVACAVPLLVVVSLLMRVLPVPRDWAPAVSLVLWGGAMLGLWVGLGRLLPATDRRSGGER